MMSDVRWIDQTETIVEALGTIGPGALAVDTEADSLHHYPEKVCLMQLTFDGVDYLLDPLSDADPRALETILADPDRTKILHGADYDVRLLHRDFGLEIRGLFDTMVAARLVGERAFGLAALLSANFDVTLDKRLQRADWSRRPLTPEMRDYAAMDTRYLHELARLLTERLEAAGRAGWAREEFAKIESVRWGAGRDPELFRRVKGSGALNRRQLAVLRELVGWREAEARRRDRPPFRVLRDESLLLLARESPNSLREVTALDLPRPWRYEAGARTLLEPIVLAAALPEDELPVIVRRERRPAAFEARLKRFGRQRDELAAELELEPGVVAPRAALAAILEAHDEGRDPALGSELRPWQQTLVLPLLEREGSN